MLCRLTAAALMPLIPLATACTTVATVRRPAQFIASKAPDIVWVTTTDNSQVVLLSPRVRGDTLGGLAGGYITLKCRCRACNRCGRVSPRRDARSSWWAGSP